MSEANEVDGKDVSRVVLMNQSELTMKPNLCFKKNTIHFVLLSGCHPSLLSKILQF
jgi:hypothetical protein